MSQKEMSRLGQNPFRGYLLAGIAGGAFAGSLFAYFESMFLLATVGPFWVDFAFLLKALLLYGLTGSVGGGFCSMFLYFVFFRRHALRKIQPWVFFFILLSACGLVLETLFYLMDIHTFRNLRGEWTTLAYFVFLGGIVIAGLLGLIIKMVCRKLSQGGIRKRLLSGGITLLLFFSVFLFTRGFIILKERPHLTDSPGNDAETATNIIILLVDALRSDHLSAYGYTLPTSPAIDRLADKGVLFRNCYAVSNWTVPTHASIFTGLYPSSHGNFSMYSSLDTTIPTMAHIFAGKGYRTASFTDNRLLGPSHGLSRGFQTALGVDNVNKVSLTIIRLWERMRGNRSMSKTILDVAGKWIENKSPRRQPFLLFVNFLDAHFPYRPKKPYIFDFLRSLPDKNVNVKLAEKLITDEVNTKKAANDLWRQLTPADWRWLERFYDSNIRGIDDQINGFLARLQAKGFLKNTLVIITSDHGEFFGEQGIGGHLNLSMHNAGLHIPLIFWLPNRLAPKIVERPVSQVDIFPTVLELAGFSAAIPGNAQGRDLFSVPEDRELLAEFYDDIRKRFSRAFFSGDFKLVIAPAEKKELYDLKNDPGEKTDLAQLNPELADTLALRLEKFLQSMPQRKSREEARKKKNMEKLLKSLGYL